MLAPAGADLRDVWRCRWCRRRPVVAQVTVSKISRTGKVARRLTKAYVCASCQQEIGRAIQRREQEIEKE